MERSMFREQGRTFLCFSEAADQADSFPPEMEMVRRNRIPGVLKLTREWMDDRRYEKYEITGLHSLASWLELRRFEEEQLKSFLKQLSRVLLAAEEYLIGTELLSLDPEMIFLKLDTWEYHFCFLPSEEKDSLRRLALFLLEHVEETPGAVFTALRFFRMTGEKELLPEQLLALCGEEVEPEEEERPDPFYEEPAPSVPEKKPGFFKWLKERLFSKPLKEEELYPPAEEWYLPQEETEEERRQRERLESWKQEPTKLLYVEEEDEGFLTLLEKETGNRICPENFPFVIGSLKQADYQPPFEGISRMHVRLEQDEEGIWVTDLNSTNGTKKNGELLQPGKRELLLRHDILNLAGVIYEVC